MKQNTLRRILALVLAIAMFGSDLALVTLANDGIYCGIEDHVHTDACYVQQTEPAATETVPGTEPAATETTPATEPAATETTPATEAPAETTPATEPAATETTPATEPEAAETIPEVEEEPAEVVTDEAMMAAEPSGPINGIFENTVYLDLGLKGITINNSTYSGQVYVMEEGGTTPTVVNVSGTFSESLTFHVFQSNTDTDGKKGYLTINSSGEIIGKTLPNYTPVKVGDTDWGNYITDNHGNGIEYTDVHEYGGVKAVARAWGSAADTERNGTMNVLDIAVAGQSCTVIIDDIWTERANTNYVNGTYGGLRISAATTGNTIVTLKLEGDNRLDKLFYYTGDSVKTSRLIITSNAGDGSYNGTLTVIGDQTGIYSNSSYYTEKCPQNNWNSVIGGGDGAKHVHGYVFKGGTIYAGSTPLDNCTAIGGGGNGHTTITINGGRITAVANSTGTAIGGGIGHQSPGGNGNVTINGGEIYAYNYGQPAYKTIHRNTTALGVGSEYFFAASHIPGTAIGGGSSIKSDGTKGTVTIGGSADVYAVSLGGAAIGGGNSVSKSGGAAEVTITGGTVEAYSLAKDNYATVDGKTYNIAVGTGIGGGNSNSGGTGGNASVKVTAGNLTATAIGGGNSVTGKGGNIVGATNSTLPGIHFSGNSTIRTGEIGGGKNQSGEVGYASALIEGGDIRGQFVMKASSQGNCTFTMTGGEIHDTKLLNPGTYKHTQLNGGALYMDDPNGTATLSGDAIIRECGAENGGAVYMTAGSFTISDTAQIVDCNASANGGAIYLGSSGTSQGTFTMTNGTIAGNKAEKGLGGAIYLDGGNANVSDGTIGTEEKPNTAKSGGGAYLNGGTLTMTGGSFAENIATEKGGGAYISGGDFNLNGENATITGNKAVDGAGIYLTGGKPNLLVGSMVGNTATGDGGGIYIDKQLVNLKPTGLVTITGNGANRGGGIFIGGTNGTDACFSVDSTDGGTANLSSNTAAAEGGAVCINNGYFTLSDDKITLQDNQAADGGAVAVLSGNFTMSDGSIGEDGHGNEAVNGGAVYVGGGNAYVSGGDIQYNRARQDGGGIAVSGGNVYISGGDIQHNEAQQNGGGITVSDGDIIMSDGNVNNNRAVSGSGGGMYVTSTSDQVEVKVYSGHIEYNSALDSGGAVAVKGSTGSDIKVRIGVNQVHPGSAFVHTEAEGIYTHAYCPQIKNNTSKASGGAFYITGGRSTNLNMYCLEDGGNIASGDSDINHIHLSDFLKVDGGQVVITTASAEKSNCDCGGEPHDHDNDDNMGHAVIQGSVHVTGGTLDLYGNMDNPAFEQYITVDTTKEEDHYYDHRDNKNNIKLVYHENFNYNGVIDSTYTAIDLQVGDTATISDSFYQHEGYRIFGWNTDPEATPNTTEGWYDNGKKYLFIKDEEDENKWKLEDKGAQEYHKGDLTLYAIWEPNGYKVHYDPNATTYTGEPMPDQQFTYNVAANLRANTYGRVGYTFEGWRYKNDNGEDKTLNDGQEVMNLTKIRGGTVELKAIWEPCSHNSGRIAYTIATESDQNKVLIKTCLDCQYKATATLTAEDAVYDGASHLAKVVCSDTVWFNITSITYTGMKIGKTESVEDPQSVINAGNYTATITAEDGTAASVAFTIEKADQPAPTVKPTYTEPESESDILKVHPLELVDGKDVNTSPKTHLRVEFIARYYTDGNLNDTDWHGIEKDGETYKDTEISLPAELKYYFVYCRYAGSDNYNPSPEVMADGAFLFVGNITLRFVVDPGITYELTEETGQLKVNVLVDDDHYLVSGSPTVTKEDDAERLRLSITENDEWSFFITKNPEATDTGSVTITIRIGTARSKPTIASSVQEKQIFATVVNDEDPRISRDSAYTVSYTVTHYEQDTYQEPVLVFTESLPEKTAIIMLDKSGAKTTYWSYTLTNSKDRVMLDSFKRMGGSDVFNLAERYEELELQFIVDFSQVTGGFSDDDLDTTLSIAKKEKDGKTDEGAPELAADPEATVKLNLSTVSHGLTYNDGVGLTHTFTYSYAAGDAASKWDDRELALLVELTNPPADAALSARINDTWHTVRSYAPGKFIIPIGIDRSGTVSITLVSDMIPAEGGTYAATCMLYAAQSVAEAAPLNGTELGAASCAFTKSNQNVAVSIEEGADRHLFSPGESITVTVNTALQEGYTLKLQLEQLNDQGIYIDKGRRSTSIGDHKYQFQLNDLVSDSYRILAIVENEDGFAVLEAPYYFFIE